jgi:hypothetical protein
MSELEGVGKRADGFAPAPVKEDEGAAPWGRRDFGLAKQIEDVEQAAVNWGVHVDALEGRFVRALLKAIEETGRTNLAALGDLEALIEKTRRLGEGERKRLEILIKGGEQTLTMARQAAETAAVAGERAEKEFNASVSRIARDLSVKLLAESQQWLVLRQTERNRRDAWRLAVSVAAASLSVFVAGYATAGWRQVEESEAEQAVVAAVERCWKKPITLRDVRGEPVEMCRLEDIVPKGGG